MEYLYNKKSELTILRLAEHPEYFDRAAVSFARQWGIDREKYEESMDQCIEDPNRVPQWYIVADKFGNVVGGCGIIENDFHKRPDLHPNVCALFVQPEYRNNGVAKSLLNLARRDISSLGYRTLYLLTSHTEFYEKCGWTYLCDAECDNGEMARVYTAKALKG